MDKYKFSMKQKYGPDWEKIIFKKKEKTNPLFDATDVKAEVHENLDQRQLELQRKEVLNIIRNFGPVTDNEIARRMNINPSTVSARRNELVQKSLVIPELDRFGNKLKRHDPITKIPNTLWVINS